MSAYTLGATREEALVIGSDQAINFLGDEGARVLSTPQMILYMERMSRNLILPMLDPGHDTVGTHVNVAHRLAAPLGATVTFSSELLAVNGKRAEFRVEARLGDRIVGDGFHQRGIIDVARFAEKSRGNTAG